MFTRAELMDAINEFDRSKHTIQNCEKLAAIYTVLDHLDEPGYSGYSYSKKDPVDAEIGFYGDSEFLEIVSGKPEKDVLLLVNELVEAVSVFNPRLQSNFLDKLRAL